jgi:AcrR family transcriptional regulator
MSQDRGEQGPEVRERLLSTASRLFYREGTRAVGIDLIVAQSKVAKASLYRHFPTKDALIEAFLRQEDEEFWRQWDKVASLHPDAPVDELMAQLAWIGGRIARDTYRGCPQINVAAEYSDELHPARQVAIAHKAEMRGRLERLAAAIGTDEPGMLAMQLAIVIDGALSSGKALHRPGPAAFLQRTAEALIRASAGP